MALDGLVLKATIAELQNSLIGAKINKILQQYDDCTNGWSIQSLILLMHLISVCYLENI